jgi:hypothetical protein
MNNIQEFIKTKERKNFPFVPDQGFYNSVNINKKRWAKIIRNEISPTLIEIQSIAKFFGVNVNEIIEFEPSEA